MKFFRTIVFAILTLFSFLPAPTKAQHANFPASECAQSADEFHLNDAVGSSEFMANLRGAEDSIRVVVKKFLDDALTSDLKLTCPDSCEQTGADIFYRAAPSAYMEQKKQRAICIELEHQTTEAPLQFARRHCESLEEMNDSLMLFSCGKSAQDKILINVVDQTAVRGIPSTSAIYSTAVLVWPRK